MCMELLANNLIRESSQNNLGLGVKLYPKADRIPGLLFADDCLIFGKADTTTCWRIKQILDLFCESSDQLINYHKLTLTFSINATSTHRQMVAGIFNITHSDSLGRYLGCPVFQNKPKHSTFKDLVDRIMIKLDG